MEDDRVSNKILLVARNNKSQRMKNKTEAPAGKLMKNEVPEKL